MIAFTATLPEEEEPLEEKLFNDFFGQPAFDSKLSLKPVDGQQDLDFDVPEQITNENMIQMIKRRTTPVIVYCTESHCERIEKECEDHKSSIFINNRNHHNAAFSPNRFGDLDTLMRVNSQSFPILILTDPQLMRGHNFRSEVGIALFLCRSFKTLRDAT